MSGLPSLREKPIDLARRLNDLARLAALNRGLCALEEARELRRLDAFADGLIDPPPGSLKGDLRLAVQRDLDAFHDPLRRRDESFRLIEGPSRDRLLPRTERLERLPQIDVMRDETV